jgi:hypothetical protein
MHPYSSAIFLHPISAPNVSLVCTAPLCACADDRIIGPFLMPIQYAFDPHESVPTRPTVVPLVLDLVSGLVADFEIKFPLLRTCSPLHKNLFIRSIGCLHATVSYLCPIHRDGHHHSIIFLFNRHKNCPVPSLNIVNIFIIIKVALCSEVCHAC